MTPTNLELEQALLGLILNQNAAFFALPADLKADHFYEPLHQRIFETLSEVIQNGGAADPISLRSRFDADPSLKDIGGGAYLRKIAMMPPYGASAPEYARLVTEIAIRRRVIEECTKAIQKAEDMASGESGEIIASLTTAIDQNDLGIRRYKVSTERQVSERLYERLKNRKASDCVPSGFPHLDEAMQGGLYKGKLYGIVGRKKMGKTMLAGTISTNMQLAGHKHMYIALEMGSDEIQQRNLARIANVYESAFRTDYAGNQDFQKKIAEYAVQAKNYRIYLDAPGISFADLKHILPMYIRRYGIGGFILDCWQLVGGKKNNKSTAEHLDDVAQWLAETVKVYGVWGMVTAQENQDDNTRGGEGIRLACDQLYRLKKSSEESRFAWLEMMETRYTSWGTVGTETEPYLAMSDKGTHYEVC